MAKRIIFKAYYYIKEKFVLMEKFFTRIAPRAQLQHKIGGRAEAVPHRVHISKNIMITVCQNIESSCLRSSSSYKRAYRYMSAQWVVNVIYNTFDRHINRLPHNKIWFCEDAPYCI